MSEAEWVETGSYRWHDKEKEHDFYIKLGTQLGQIIGANASLKENELEEREAFKTVSNSEYSEKGIRR